MLEEMDQTLNTRTVKANGVAIKRLRSERGWRVEDLAKKAGCSVKTVKNVERGSNVYLFTLSKISKVFDVEYSTLILGSVGMPETPETQEGRRRNRTFEVSLRITTPIDEIDETHDLIKLLQLLIERIGGDPIEPTGLREGSTEVIVKMSESQVVYLIEQYINNNLDDLDIISIKAEFPFSIAAAEIVDGDKAKWTEFATKNNKLSRVLTRILRSRRTEEAS